MDGRASRRLAGRDPLGLIVPVTICTSQVRIGTSHVRICTSHDQSRPRFVPVTTLKALLDAMDQGERAVFWSLWERYPPSSIDLTGQSHERPFECYPESVVGAVSPSSEPLFGRLSPKADRTLKRWLVIVVWRALRGLPPLRFLPSTLKEGPARTREWRSAHTFVPRFSHLEMNN